MRKFLKSSFIIGSSQLLVNLVQILRMKYLAVSIGPQGMGIFGLLSSFFMFLGGFYQAWINSTIIKFTASAASRNNQHQHIFIITLLLDICFITSVLGILPILIFPYFFRDIFLSSQVLIIFILLYAISFLFNNLYSQLYSYLQGLQRFGDIGKSRIIISIIELLLVVLFTYFFGLYGFFVSLALSAIVGFVLLYIIIKPSIIIKKGSFKQHKELLSRIIRFSKVNIFLGVYYLGSLYILRKLIADNLGIDQLGLFFAAFSFSTQLGLLVQSLSYYSVSELSKDIDDAEKSRNINDYIYIALIISNPILVMVIMWQGIITKIFFSNSFNEMTSFFYLLIFSQFIIYSLSIFVNVIWTAEKMREHAIVSIVYCTLNVIIAWLLIPRYGLFGVALGIFIGTLLSHLLAYNFVKKIITFEFKESVLKIMGISFLIVISSVLCKDSLLMVKILIFIISVAYSFTAIEKHHKSWLLSKIASCRGFFHGP